jgi:hypothetical protein
MVVQDVLQNRRLPMTKLRLIAAAALAACAFAAPAGAVGYQQQFEITYEPQECPAGYMQEIVYSCTSDRQCVLIGYTCTPG